MEIRALQVGEYSLLGDFLYRTLFVPPGATMPPRNIVQTPELAHYADCFGRFGDIAVAAQDGDLVIGIAWSRILDGSPAGYGNVGPGVPELAVAVLPGWRDQGVGTALVRELIDQVSQSGFGQLSLSVQRMNPALRLYQRLGFVVVRENEADLVLTKHLG